MNRNENEIDKETKNRRVLSSSEQNENEKETKNRRVLRISKQNEKQKDAKITISNKTIDLSIDDAAVRSCESFSKAMKKNGTAANKKPSLNENKKDTKLEKKESTRKINSKAPKRRIEISDTEKIMDPAPESKKRKLSKNQEVILCKSERVTRSKAKAQVANESQKGDIRDKIPSNSDKYRSSKTNSESENSSRINKNKPKIEQIVKQCPTSRGSSPNNVDFEKKKDPNLENVNENIGQKLDEIAVMDFRIGDVVWAKIRGYPGWPARIESIYGDKKQTFRVYWFNDYRISNIYRSQIYKFHLHFEKFAKLFDSHIGLETAAKEAMMYLVNKEKN